MFTTECTSCPLTSRLNPVPSTTWIASPRPPVPFACRPTAAMVTLSATNGNRSVVNSSLSRNVPWLTDNSSSPIQSGSKTSSLVEMTLPGNGPMVETGPRWSTSDTVIAGSAYSWSSSIVICVVDTSMRGASCAGSTATVMSPVAVRASDGSSGVPVFPKSVTSTRTTSGTTLPDTGLPEL